MGLLHPQSECWQPPVLSASGLTGQGLAEVWEQVERYCERMKASGRLESKRRDQALLWMEAALRDLLLEDLYRSDAVRKILPTLRQQVLDGQVQPTAAARRLLRHHVDHHSS